MLLPMLKHFERKMFYIHDSSEDNKTNDKRCLKEKQHLTDILKVNNCYFQFISHNRVYSNKRKERKPLPYFKMDTCQCLNYHVHIFS